jgi:hypothetical protein
MPSSRSLHRGFVSVLATTGLVFAGVALSNQLQQLRVVDSAFARGTMVTVLLLTLLSGPAAAVLSLVLAWRSGHREDARALATFLALTGFVLGGDGLWFLVQGSGVPAWLASTADLSVPVCGLAGMAAMLRFSCTFPRPLAPAELPPAQRWCTDAGAVRRVAAWAIAALIVVPESARIAAAAWWQPLPELRAVKYVVLAMLVASLALSATNLRAGHRGADAEGRRRIYWVLEGFLLATAIAVVASALKLLQDVTGYTPPLRFWYPLAIVAAFTALLACLAIAMFYAGAVDPALAIRRTAVAGLVGLAMVVLFAALEQALQGWLGARLGLSDRAGGIMTGVMVGFAFEPVRARTAAFVERVLAPGRGAAIVAPLSEPA